MSLTRASITPVRTGALAAGLGRGPVSEVAPPFRAVFIPMPHRPRGPDMRAASRPAIIHAAKALARTTRGRLTLAHLHRKTGIAAASVYYWFPQGWFHVLKEAGLADRASRNQPVSLHSLMLEFHRVASRLRRLPTRREFRTHSRRSISAYQLRIGSHAEVLQAYDKWLRTRGLPSPPCHRLRGPTSPSPSTRPTPAQSVRSAPDPLYPSPAHLLTCSPAQSSLPTSARHHKHSVRRAYGRPLALRGIAHEPMNESGVVHLAGILWQELGLIVIRMREQFPDCEAWRRLRGTPEAWQRIRVEFEFRSTGFKEHRRKAAECDLVICWEHNWDDCPVEVIELKRLVRTLHDGGGLTADN